MFMGGGALIPYVVYPAMAPTTATTTAAEGCCLVRKWKSFYFCFDWGGVSLIAGVTALAFALFWRGKRPIQHRLGTAG